MSKIPNPFRDKILIKPTTKKNETDGGLYIPDSVIEKPRSGVVIAVGRGTKDEPMDINIGEEVLFVKNRGIEVVVDNCSYLIVRQEDILCSY